MLQQRLLHRVKVGWMSLLYYYLPSIATDDMVLEGPNQKQSTKEATRISTHGPRGSRREDWRRSRGLDPIPKRNGMNRQGGLAARRKAGRPSRRR